MKAQLGTGRHGKVFLSTGPNGVDVAVKILDPDVDENGAASFERKRESMQLVKHPAILSCLASNPAGMIIMPYMPNGALSSILDKFYGHAAPPGWDATARSKAVVGIASGMAAIHSAGHVHGDLRPDNILLDDRYEIRIANIGRDPNQSVEAWESPDTAITRAPEVLDSLNYTPDGDVYSYAVCLYLLFAPALALDGPAHQNIRATRSLEDHIKNGDRLVHDEKIPPFYWNLITTCWKQAPSHRPTFAQILCKLGNDRAWILEGSDIAAVEEYEARVTGSSRVDRTNESTREPPALQATGISPSDQPHGADEPATAAPDAPVQAKSPGKSSRCCLLL
jgi:serine/threonine protein kinase